MCANRKKNQTSYARDSFRSRYGSRKSPSKSENIKRKMRSKRKVVFQDRVFLVFSLLLLVGLLERCWITKKVHDTKKARLPKRKKNRRRKRTSKKTKGNEQWEMCHLPHFLLFLSDLSFLFPQKGSCIMETIWGATLHPIWKAKNLVFRANKQKNLIEKNKVSKSFPEMVQPKRVTAPFLWPLLFPLTPKRKKITLPFLGKTE